MEALCIGTELRTAVLNRPDAWRSLIADVREVYGGELTYSANWYREFEEVPFWDALDYIGIQVYFPLADSTGSKMSLDAFKAAWAPHVARIEALQQRVGKPVLFTEVGYPEPPRMRPWSRGSGGRPRRWTMNCRRPFTRRCSRHSGANPGLQAPTSGNGSPRAARDSVGDAHAGGNEGSRRRENRRKWCSPGGIGLLSCNQEWKPTDYRKILPVSSRMCAYIECSSLLHIDCFPY